MRRTGMAVAAALGIGTAAAQEADPSAAAHDLMRQVNRKYEALRPIPRQAILRISATVSAYDRPDRTVRGTAIALQRDRAARFDMDSTLVERAEAPFSPDTSSPAGHLVWVTDGDVLRARYAQPPGSGIADREFRVDLSRLPEGLSAQFRDPMSEPELAAQYLQTPFSVEERVHEGRIVRVLRSQAAVAFTGRSRAFVTLTVDPASMLIVRAAYEGSYRGGREGEHYYYATVIDVAYRLYVPIADDAFALTLAPDAEDATPLVAEEGRAALGMAP
ncbi:hypothetical protein [Methylobacterium nonmethylotrophicum]|uniref:Uncharacterized protein n=1 Tax=Methylobacterium nonmethylotrophicum TaxID=1141884 RepID=A0A4Z0NI18_9HYPH|nr:hypothetical protein [Methylobacterium nonmethylotrophicum]TGD95125.1 hypothetical protein EU555_29560 [Methylobacterium nonmethylotrophicum]